MSAFFAPSVRPEPESDPRLIGWSERPAASWIPVWLAALRWFVVGGVALVLAAGWFYVSFTVESYAVHLCGWPATISCPSSSVWSLVQIGFGLTALVGLLTAVSWATTGRGAALAAAYPLWVVVFPVVVYLMGPRHFDQSDLVVVGGYAGLSIELLRQTAVMWMPTRRQQWLTAAISFAVVYAVLLSLVPVHLANLAP